MHAAILLAAGFSQRMAQAGLDKTVMRIAGMPVIGYSIAAFLRSGITHTFWITYRDADQLRSLKAITLGFPEAMIHWIAGGATRAQSVINALNAMPQSVKYVFIHDSARPLITSQSLRDLKSAVEAHGAAVLAHKVKDTIKSIPSYCSSSDPTTLKDLDRSTLWAMETPQVFKYSVIREAYDRAPLTITDDTAAASLAGHRIQLVENTHPNPKLTTAEDITYIEYLLTQRRSNVSKNV